MKFYKKFAMADPKRVVSKAIRDARKNKAVSVYGFTMKKQGSSVRSYPENGLPKSWVRRIKNERIKHNSKRGRAKT